MKVIQVYFLFRFIGSYQTTKKLGDAYNIAYVHVNTPSKLRQQIMKDFVWKGKEAELTVLGQGEVAVKAAAQTGAECGAEWFVIEQDDHPAGTPMENMEQGLVFLKKCMEE